MVKFVGMKIYIDTKDAKTTRVSLIDESIVIEKLSKKNQFGSQVLLPMIKKLLDKKRVPQLKHRYSGRCNRIDFKDIKEVGVEIGPGSFTGLKVGVSIANALGFTLGIPVNGKKIETDLIY